MSQQSFNHICDQLSVFIERRTTTFRYPHPVGKRVMVTLWRLATNIEFRTLGHLFGMGRSTACMIFHDVVDAINSILLPKYIKFPTGQALRNTIDGFRTRWGFPQCCGAIDGTHIPIIAPKEHHADYYNRKCHHSILLQAVVDYNYRFTNINVGHAGKHHDAHVLRKSSVFLKASAGELLLNWTENLDNVEVPPFIIGDPAYPLLTWLMKAYPGNNLSRLSRARMTVECAFGRLKGRWRCLIKRLDNELYRVSGIAKACCTLHNLCEVHGDFFNENWLEDIDDNVNVPANRNDDNANTDAKQIRKAITNWLKDN
ncbi:uncharacterized protein LOC134696969 [Mytilus trossulus]|uniref:uncharacterized protein LOC134696969 n=1 Tax=Mytilus trossulus TaxID=6551 RepID=UPI0030063798